MRCIKFHLPTPIITRELVQCINFLLCIVIKYMPVGARKNGLQLGGVHVQINSLGLHQLPTNWWNFFLPFYECSRFVIVVVSNTRKAGRCKERKRRANDDITGGIVGFHCCCVVVCIFISSNNIVSLRPVCCVNKAKIHKFNFLLFFSSSLALSFFIHTRRTQTPTFIFMSAGIKVFWRTVRMVYWQSK